MYMLKNTLTATLSLSAVLNFASTAMADDESDKQVIERGRYIVSIAGCNDCHTPGYPHSGGNIPQSEWLPGNTVGFNGPWGTTYPTKLRLLSFSFSAVVWFFRSWLVLRPLMSWFALRDMKEDDVRAVYHFIRSLGAKGETAPAYLPPGQTAATPYIEFVPKNLPAQAHADH